MPIAAALAICGLDQQAAVTAFNREGLANVRDFADLTDSEIISMCESMGKRTRQAFPVGALPTQKIRALAMWARDLSTRQLAVNDGDFTQALLAIWLTRLDATPSEEHEVKKPPKFNPDIWDVWEPAFVNYLSSLLGAQGTPLSYIVRDPSLTIATIDPTNEFLLRQCQVALAGHAFDMDNRRVAQELLSLCTDTAAIGIIPADGTDGRAMFTALRDVFNGDGEVSRRHTIAKANYEALHYKSENAYPWNDFMTQLLRNLSIMERAGHPRSNQEKHTDLMAKIQDPGLESVKEIARTQHPHNFQACLNFIGTRITERNASHFALQGRLRSKGRGGKRYVSNVTSSGKGRGGGRSGGRSSGRGGRSGRSGKGGRGGPKGSTHSFNGVDITDPTRTFKPQEWQALGRQGHAIVWALRNNKSSDGSQSPSTARSPPGGNYEARIRALETASAATMGEGTSQISEVTMQTNPSTNSQTNPQTPQTAGRGFGRGLHMQARGSRG